MTNNLAVEAPRSLDEFAGWSDEVESHDEQTLERAIIGELMKFTNEGQWILRDHTPLTKVLIAVNVRRTLTKWGKNKRPVPPVIFLQAGEKIPDVGKLNDETPKSEWVEDYNGKLKGPWQAQHIVYLIDPISIDQYSFPTSTVGGGIAVRELVDRINWMRRFRGNAVYPVVQLSTRHMKTTHGGGRPRPHFEIEAWKRFDPGSDGTIPTDDPRQLPPQQPIEQVPMAAPDAAKKMEAVLHAIGAQTVEPPSLKEEMQDEILF
jgi:hypothetical protein